MKNGMSIIKFSSFVLILLVTYFTGLASADHYICRDPKANQAKIVVSPSQCLKPFVLHTITDAQFAQTFPDSVSQNKSGRRRPAPKPVPKPAPAPCTVICIPIDDTALRYCCCSDGTGCEILPNRR
jgi:hypothetical protein